MVDARSDRTTFEAEMGLDWTGALDPTECIENVHLLSANALYETGSNLFNNYRARYVRERGMTRAGSCIRVAVNLKRVY